MYITTQDHEYTFKQLIYIDRGLIHFYFKLHNEVVFFSFFQSFVWGVNDAYLSITSPTNFTQHASIVDSIDMQIKESYQNELSSYSCFSYSCFFLFVFFLFVFFLFVFFLFVFLLFVFFLFVFFLFVFFLFVFFLFVFLSTWIYMLAAIICCNHIFFNWYATWMNWIVMNAYQYWFESRIQIVQIHSLSVLQSTPWETLYLFKTRSYANKLYGIVGTLVLSSMSLNFGFSYKCINLSGIWLFKLALCYLFSIYIMLSVL